MNMLSARQAQQLDDRLLKAVVLLFAVVLMIASIAPRDLCNDGPANLSVDCATIDSICLLSSLGIGSDGRQLVAPAQPQIPRSIFRVVAVVAEPPMPSLLPASEQPAFATGRRTGVPGLGHGSAPLSLRI